jgi:hypothetical protein
MWHRELIMRRAMVMERGAKFLPLPKKLTDFTLWLPYVIVGVN